MTTSDWENAKAKPLSLAARGSLYDRLKTPHGKPKPRQRWSLDKIGAGNPEQAQRTKERLAEQKALAVVVDKIIGDAMPVLLAAIAAEPPRPKKLPKKARDAEQKALAARIEQILKGNIT